MTYKIIIVGLGNPILGDDGIGWKVTDKFNQLLNSHETFINKFEINVDNLAVGGLGLMERLVGYDHAIIIDAIQTGRYPIGNVGILEFNELKKIPSTHTVSVHDMNLPTAIELGQRMNLSLPSKIDIIGIETEVIYDFTEEITPAVKQAILPAVNIIKNIIDELEKLL